MTHPNDQIHPFTETHDFENVTLGLTKREHFAAMILQGLAVSYNANVEHIALTRISVSLADSLIVALNENQP